MSEDKAGQAIVEALKQALAEPGAQRLYRSGKLPGLFPGRSGTGGEAAARALREGLLEVVRTETRGKVAIEWTRPTPRAVQYLHERQSPIHVLEEVREALRSAEQGLPGWLAEMRRELETLSQRLTTEAERLTQRLEALSRRVEDTLERLENERPPLPEGLAATLPWASDALAYLDQRREGAKNGDCPLPELFAALAKSDDSLSVTAFHDGLRRLGEQRLLRLLPFNGPPDQLPQPEFALFDGKTLLYYAAR